MTNLDKIKEALEAIQDVMNTPAIIDQHDGLYEDLTVGYDALMRAFAKTDPKGFSDYRH